MIKTKIFLYKNDFSLQINNVGWGKRSVPTNTKISLITHHFLSYKSLHPLKILLRKELYQPT